MNALHDSPRAARGATKLPRYLGVAAAFALLSGPSCQLPCHGPGSATLVLLSGKVWTGDPALPEAQAIAVSGPRILAIGTDREVLGHVGRGARVIDLRGRRVVPGFIDSHLHFLSGGDDLLFSDLRQEKSEEAFARRLAEAAAGVPEGTWLTSGRWDHENWPGARLPTRQSLDRFVPRHPVLASRVDGHMAVANSLALEIAGVSRDTPEPEGGTIVRDPRTGEPTGVLKDAAMDLVRRHVPPWTIEQKLERARAAVEHAAELGVTGVHDMMGSFAALGVYQELRDRGELSVRVTAYTPIAAHGRWGAVEVRRGFGDRFLKLGGVKGFADGSLGSSTALFLEPYRGSPENRGLALTDLSEGGRLEKQVRAAREQGLQLAVHGIGDRAVRSLLDIYERVGGEDVRRERFRIEHSQHIHPEDLARFGELGVIASAQPYHAVDDGRWAEKRIGRERCETSYAFRDLLDRGAPLAFGSDWPVAPLSPLKGIQAAVTRATLDGKNPGGWFAQQKISVEEALRAYTLGSAHAAFAEDELGTLTPGKLADLVVLDRDLLGVEPREIGEVRVDLTIVDGKVVHERRE